MDSNHEKISIGLPVFNGEKFLQKKINSLLCQTYTNFELIISDNASMDSTSEICKEFAKKDKRIRYFRQEKTIAPLLNYYFTLEKSKFNYFVWTAVDDILLPTFIEKNLDMISNNDNIASSVSKMKLYGPMTEYMESDFSNKSFFSKIHKRIYKKMGYQDTYPVSGNYENRIKEYFKNIRHNQVLYGIYRTEQIKKSFVKDSFLGNDTAITINILKYGELHVIDEVLMEVYDSGISRSGMIQALRKLFHKNIGLILPFFPFTLWCFRKLDKKKFFRHTPFFIKINCEGLLSLCIDIFRQIK